jgi:hypothetical protein
MKGIQMKLITYDQVGEIIKRDHPEARNIWRFDKEYCAPSKQEFGAVLKEVAPIELQFRDELFDCEDFALVMSAFVRMKAALVFPKAIAFGEVTVKKASGEVHTLNILITDKHEVLYFEPQAKIFVDGRNYKPFFVRI